MTEIKVLDKSIFNRIAAGEVVERPASIVKELLENSIDAGAKSITITVCGGGVSFIRVSDDGCGISPDCIKTAFLPHATSKIKNIEDLDAIETLGFRGEALPSIASVAKVTMFSRRRDSELGITYCVDNGNELDYGEMGGSYGTVVTVENLFADIPARKKFLASDRIEENAITNVVARAILANCDVAFEYVLNDKLIYKSYGNGLSEAIKTVYGNEFFSNLVKIENTSSDITVSGYIGKPSYTKSSKSYQTLVINNRYVQNDDISYTIFGCYQKYLMKRQFPAYVIHMTVPYDLVDVNVHPNKLEVKFALPGIIKKVVADTVKTQVLASAITDAKSVDDVFTFRSDIKINETVPPSIDELFVSPDMRSSSRNEEMLKSDKSHLETSCVECDSADVKNMFVAHDKSEETPPSQHALKQDILSAKSAEKQEVVRAKITSSFLGDIPDLSQKAESKKILFHDSSSQSLVNGTDIYESVKSAQNQFSLGGSSQCKLVGKLFNTYIIVEDDANIYLVDQHAAHEKLLYDKFETQFAEGNEATQQMLVPYRFSLSPQESNIIDENLESITKMGFSLSKLNEENYLYELSGVPSCCSKINVKEFIDSFIAADSLNATVPLPLKERLAQAACKAAIKGGEDDLSLLEIESLLSALKLNKTELFCPHGRPIIVKIKRTEIEKWFKRIV